MKSIRNDTNNIYEKKLINIYHNKNLHPLKQENNNNSIKTKVQLRNTINSKVTKNLKNEKNIIVDKSSNNYFSPWNTNHLIIIILLLIFQKRSIILCQRKICLYSYSITIKIKGTKKQKIYNKKIKENDCHYFQELDLIADKVYINNIEQNVYNEEYTLNETENVVQLVWNETKDYWGCLFRNIENIIYLDFSNFDFSKGLYANTLFYNCTSLTSINFNYNGTIKINDAGSMFRLCKSLVSLNLSNFDMSEVTDIGGMFEGCNLLTSMDLSNYAPKVSITTLLFNECPNLQYINIKNISIIKDYENLKDMFSTNINFVVCTYDTKIIEMINNNYRCATIDCSDNWREKQKKINPFDNDNCINSCLETEHKYNYKSKCTNICQNRTYNNSFTCEDCHSDCKTCEKS